MFVPRMLTPIARSGATHILETYTAASLLSTLTTLGLTTNLKLCLDAGEGDSYTSGQSWLDLSGNGYDFFRGATSGATTDDPTFSGVADALSANEYWSFDGGDYFLYDSANENWMNNLHKDGALFTLAGWVYPGTAAQMGVFGTSGINAANIGIAFFFNASTGILSCYVYNGSGAGTARSMNFDTAGVVASAWQFIAVSVDEAASLVTFARNASFGTAAASYSSPSAAAATLGTAVGGGGGSTNRLTAGSRLAMFAAWEGRALTAWELEQIYNKTRRRFGV